MNGRLNVARAAAALLAMSAASGVWAEDQQQAPTMGPGMMGQDMMGPGMMGPGVVGMGPGMMGQGMMGRPMMGPGMMMDIGPMVEGRLAYLKAELAIADLQADAWTGYVAAVKAQAALMQEMHKTMGQAMQQGSAVDRIRAHAAAMQSMADGLKGLTPATEALYKVLTDEQRKKADMLLGGGCCIM
jgi:hypothetical protein